MPDGLQSYSLHKIQQEIEALGYETAVSASPHGEVVSFDYEVPTGSHQGRQVRIGVSMQGSEGYPEYPPHWVHISPPMDDGRGGVTQKYTDPENRDWIAMSRPPGPSWDRFPTKHMSLFFKEHLRRLWAAM